jgi:hypothetical protein
MRVTAFLDTNIFLHYQPIEQIDWCSVLKAEAVELIVSPIVVRELDKLKDGPSGAKRAKERARRTLSRLNELWSEGVVASLREDVAIQYYLREPNIDFDAYSLSRDWNDDQLIASILTFRTENTDNSPYLVTRDVGPRLKAQSHGIQTIRLPETYELQDEPDPAEQRIRELERDLREAQNAIPQLGLRFQASGKLKTVVLPASNHTLQPWLEEQLAQIRAQYPHREYSKNQPAPKGLFNRGVSEDWLVHQMHYSQITQEEIDRYNRDLHGFYKRYQDYLQSLFEYQTLGSRSIELIFELSNTGTAPAEEIELSLHFPDGFEVIKAEDLPQHPVEPQAPVPARTQNELALASLTLGLQIPYREPSLPIFPRLGPAPNVSPARIRRTDSFEVVFHVGRLNHLRDISFETLYAVFPSQDRPRSFGIDYRLLVRNMPREQRGKLNVIVEHG